MSRLLMDVMAAQAVFEPLDYSLFDKRKDYYFAAIQAGVSGCYGITSTNSKQYIS